MLRVYVTSHVCQPNQVNSDRYWIADDQKSKLIHIGVMDVGGGWLDLLVTNLNAKVIHLNMPDDSFKKLMLEEGYEQ